jgi:hypothetical protein
VLCDGVVASVVFEAVEAVAFAARTRYVYEVLAARPVFE